MSRLFEQYNSEIKKSMQEKFQYGNVMEIPKLEKIVINIGVGDAVGNAKALEAAVNDLTIIAGQKPVITKAKKSIANFKVREGMALGTKVTLRGERMYEFLDKLINAALPRVRDFRGISATAFDGRGNYALGLKEQLIFPEIEYDQVERVTGMDIIVVTTAKTEIIAQPRKIIAAVFSTRDFAFLWLIIDNFFSIILPSLFLFIWCY